jgi:hypothetical protein
MIWRKKLLGLVAGAAASLEVGAGVFIAGLILGAQCAPKRLVASF